MSSESKKVVNLDRPRDGAAKEEYGTPAPARPKDDVDRLLSDFLEHINSLTAEYESPGASPEQLEETIEDVPAPAVAETIASIAAAVQPHDAPLDPPPAAEEHEHHDAVPLPFNQDNAELDEEIERALSALEELPALHQESPVAAAEPDILVQSEDTDAPAQAESTPPAPARTGDVLTTQEGLPDTAATQPVFTYAVADRRNRKALIALAVLGGLALVAFVAYLLLTRSGPEAPAARAQSMAPAAGPAQAAPATPIPTVATQPSSVISEGAQGTSVTPGSKAQTRENRSTPIGTLRERRPSRPAGTATVGSSLGLGEEPFAVIENPQQNRPAPASASVQAASAPVPTQIQAPPPVSQSPATVQAPSQSIPPRTESDNAPAPMRQPEPAGLPPAAEQRPAVVSTAVPPPTSRPSAVPAPPNATPAELVSKVLPRFPDFARRMNQTGTVDLEIEIDAQGKVTKATPVGGPAVFHFAAVEAVRKWAFKPATFNGKKVSSQGKVTVVFNNKR